MREAKKVAKYSKTGKLLACFPSVSQAAKDINCGPWSLSSQINRQRQIHIKGFVYRFYDDVAPKSIEVRASKNAPKTVTKYTPLGKKIKTFPSLNAAARLENLSISAIHHGIHKKHRVKEYYYAYGNAAKIIPPASNSQKVSVIKFDKAGNKLAEFPSVCDAAKEIGVSRQAVDFAFKRNRPCKGFFYVSSKLVGLLAKKS
jgi:hypothetical protein